MAKSFEILEARLMIQLNHIQSLIHNMHSPRSYQYTPVDNQHFSPPSMQYAPPQQYPIGQAYQQYLPAAHILQSSAAPYLQEISTAKFPFQPVTTTPKPTFYSTQTTHSPDTTTVLNSYRSTVTPIVNTTERTLKFRPVQRKSLGRILKPKSTQRYGYFENKDNNMIDKNHQNWTSRPRGASFQQYDLIGR